MSYISLGVLLFSCLDTCDTCDILQCFVKKCEKNVEKCKNNTAPKMCSCDILEKHSFGIYHGFDISWLVPIVQSFFTIFSTNTAKGTTNPGVDCFTQLFWFGLVGLVQVGSVSLVGQVWLALAGLIW